MEREKAERARELLTFIDTLKADLKWVLEQEIMLSAWDDYLGPKTLYLHTLGSHSKTHRSLATLYDELNKDAKKLVVDRINADIKKLEDEIERM